METTISTIHKKIHQSMSSTPIKQLIHLFLRGKNHLLMHTLDNAGYYQTKTRRYIISQLQETQYGQQYIGENSNDDVHDTITQFPIHTYETYQVHIEQAMHHPDIIRPGQITNFSVSSGTTGGKKIIPVTDESMQSIKHAGRDMLTMLAKRYPDKHIFSHKVLPLAGGIQNIDNLPDHVQAGDVSALMTLQQHPIMQQFYACPTSVLLADWDTKKDYFINHIDPHEPIIMLGVTSREVELLKQFKAKRGDDAFHTLTKHIGLIWGGVDIKPFAAQIADRGIDTTLGVYNGSEGYYGFQDIVNYNDNAPYALLPDHGIYYEFIPFTDAYFDTNGDLRDIHTDTLSLQDVNEQIDTKHKYAIVITTNAGLIRYMIGDVIQFVAPNRIRITGRTKQSINQRGEELMIDHITQTIEKLNQQYDCHIHHYTGAPHSTSNKHVFVCGVPQHVYEKLLSGRDPEINSGGLSMIQSSFDEILQDIAHDYQAKRTSKLINVPDVHIVPDSVFTGRLSKHNKLGGQHKVPALKNDMTIIKELLTIHDKG